MAIFFSWQIARLHSEDKDSWHCKLTFPSLMFWAKSRYCIVRKCDTHWNSKNILNLQFTNPITISRWKSTIHCLKVYSTGRQFYTHWEDENIDKLRLCTSNFCTLSLSNCLDLWCRQCLHTNTCQGSFTFFTSKIPHINQISWNSLTFTKVCVLKLLTIKRT